MFDWIKNRDGKKIFAVVDHPKGKGPFPAILLVHGFSGYSTELHITGISDALVSKGFLTVRPDLTNTPGKSYLDFQKMTFKQELKDAEDVLGWMLKLPEVDKSRVGIAGHSLAGLLTAQITSKRKEIKALGILSGVYSFELLKNNTFRKPLQRAIKDFKTKGFTTRWHSELEYRFKIGENYYKDMLGRSADDFIDKINVPTLVLVSGDDEAVSEENTNAWYKNLKVKDKTKEVIRGAKHVYKDEYLEEAKKEIAEWFCKKLI